MSYTESKAKLGQGTGLERGGTNIGDPYILIGETLDISGPNLTAENIEVTNHCSPNGAKEYIGALKDFGDLTFDLNFDSNNLQLLGMRSDLQNGTRNYWRLTSPDEGGEVATFKALVTGLNHSFPVQGVMTVSVTLKITGDVTYS